MNEKENKQVKEEITEKDTATYEGSNGESKGKSLTKLYIGSILIVAIIILGILYFLEKEGRSSTSIFSDMISAQQDKEAVAVVNGVEIVGAELDRSIEQFNEMASAQGADLTDENTASQIRSQALDVLVNTELLVQAARDRDIVVTDEEVDVRREEIAEQLGGEEALQARMTELDINEATLLDDLREEIIIQTLLDQVIAEADIQVTDEEIEAVYEDATAGGEENLPSLEDVRDVIRDQISAPKEEAAIEEFIQGLKQNAEIVII